MIHEFILDCVIQVFRRIREDPSVILAPDDDSDVRVCSEGDHRRALEKDNEPVHSNNTSVTSAVRLVEIDSDTANM